MQLAQDSNRPNFWYARARKVSEILDIRYNSSSYCSEFFNLGTTSSYNGPHEWLWDKHLYLIRQTIRISMLLYRLHRERDG